MKKYWMIMTIMSVCLVVFICPLQANVSPPAVGDELPEIILSVPENPEHQKYLGLTGKSTFTIPQIKAEVVIIEIFSMYCPHCQREAQTVNAFFKKIKNSYHLNRKVKLIGIGAGNSAFEVDHFRKTYNVPFPLFPDGDFSIHKKIGEVRTPYFIGIKIHKDGTHRIYYSKLGGAKRADQFLKMLLDQSGLR
jgi:peroxiredoxin